MKRFKVAFLFLSILLAAATCFAQKNSMTTGGIKGKVRAESGKTVADVDIIARQGEREVARASSNSKGDFVLAGLAPGVYGLTFRKPGLSVSTLEHIEVRAGKPRELPDRLILKVDEGTLAFLRGSVFNADGRSVQGARVELARVQADGTAKKLDSRISNDTGSFVFRLTAETAKYRITVKAEGSAPVSKDVEIDGAAVYRVALSLNAAPK
jgi:hypothetical protein